MKSRSGFTLIELALAIAFVAVLSVTVAVLTTSIIHTYERGLVLKQVNTVGMDLIDDMRSAISGSSAKEITDICSEVYADASSARAACDADQAYNFTSVARTANVKLIKSEDGSGDTVNVAVFGAFCTGTYSYIWNSGYFFDNKLYEVSDLLKPATLTYIDKDGTTVKLGDTPDTQFRLLKVNDPSRSVCVSAATDESSHLTTYAYNQSTLSSAFKIDTKDAHGDPIYPYITEEPIDILDSDNDLALYDLSAARPAQDSLTKNALFTGSFILATIKGGINITATGNYCAPPDDYHSSLNYCAINKFNFAIRATGGTA